MIEFKEYRAVKQLLDNGLGLGELAEFGAQNSQTTNSRQKKAQLLNPLIFKSWAL